MKIRIATRKSALALWQAGHVAGRLRELDDVDSVELVPMSTKGDEVLDRSLQKIGGKGLFIKELELAMQAGTADIAVHSMKDVPADLPEGFVIATVLERANPADAFVSNEWRGIDALPRGARVGSSSLRRQAQLRMLRRDLVIEPVRGNVNTRLARLDAGQFDAIILAAAGLERLGLDDRIRHAFSPAEMLPAAAQGVVGVECRADDARLIDVLGQLTDKRTLQTTTAERVIARELRASCQSPVATYATVAGGQMTLSALVALPDGSEYLRYEQSDSATSAEAIGREVAARLLADGARDLLERAEAMNG